MLKKSLFAASLCASAFAGLNQQSTATLLAQVQDYAAGASCEACGTCKCPFSWDAHGQHYDADGKTPDLATDDMLSFVPHINNAGSTSTYTDASGNTVERTVIDWSNDDCCSSHVQVIIALLMQRQKHISDLWDKIEEDITTWTNENAPKGDDGPKGEDGDRGDRGATGPAGSAGGDGDKGFKGDNGATGAVGATGADGAVGDKGSVGPDGPQGFKGARGARGDNGAAGPAGDEGAQGEVGDNGPKGDKGAQGTAGPDGNDGAKGVIGATGPNGYKGLPGKKGPTGDAGDPGIADLKDCKNGSTSTVN